MLERGWWTDSTRIIRLVRATDWRQLVSESAVAASRPDVGSSRKRSGGRATSSAPTAVRFLSPPLTPRFFSLPMAVCAQCSRPSCCRVVCTRRSRSSSPSDCGSRNRAANSIVSRTVSAARRRSSWKTKPQRRKKALVGAAPPSVTSPASSLAPLGARPARRESNDVLPEPLGPINAIISEGATQPLTSSSMTLRSPALDVRALARRRQFRLCVCATRTLSRRPLHDSASSPRSMVTRSVM